MPRLKPNQVPSYRLHKQSGQAVVTLNGADILLGKYNSAASKAEYNRRTSEWLANDRQPTVAVADLTIAELMARYKIHVEAYYRRADGTPTGEADNIGDAMKPLRKLYGGTRADDFSPLKLKAVRQAMIDPKIIDPTTTRQGWCRNVINHHCHRIIALFAWGVENELVKADIPKALREVAPLARGRSKARESEPVQPVDDAVVEATLLHLNSVVRAMVKVQRLTAARPGEIIRLRTMDIDRSADVWFYLPPQHKTAHHGRVRSVAIGPRAQEILLPFLKPLNPTAYIFSPADAVEETRGMRRAVRKTPEHQGNRPGTNRKRRRRREPGDRYTAASLRRAIYRAADAAFPVPDDLKTEIKAAKQWVSNHRWSPNQLRHTAATEIEKHFDLAASQVVLGHSSSNTTKTYVKRNQTAAGRIAAEVG